ncbi:hypothetical protein STEG23_030682, partial [Scotinomys teguina]
MMKWVGLGNLGFRNTAALLDESNALEFSLALRYRGHVTVLNKSPQERSSWASGILRPELALSVRDFPGVHLPGCRICTFNMGCFD